MKRLYCFIERVGGLVSGALMVLVAVILLIAGFAALAPVMALLFIVPIIVLCIRLFEAPLSRTCSL